MVSTQESLGKKAVLTPPVMLEGESDAKNQAPNILQQISSLLKKVRKGSDLTNFQLPPIFNMPKSQLQCFGESVCCSGTDMLGKCTEAKTPQERLISVVAWSISNIGRPVIFGVAPYNPILGETHHVSVGNLNVLLEQVSHHPPVSALHATDDKRKIEMIWCQYPVPRFCGTSIQTEVCGTRNLTLLEHGETYTMNSPKLFIRFLPPAAEWVGKVSISCQESNLRADLSYKKSIVFANDRSIDGKIVDVSSSETIYEIKGHWDRTVMVKDIRNGDIRVIYNAMETISGLNTPYVKDHNAIVPTESSVVWSEVSRGILNQEWEKASEAKREVEEKQREIQKERNSRGETWVPRHFTVTYSKANGWSCEPIQKFVPSAPIVVPDCDKTEKSNS